MKQELSMEKKPEVKQTIVSIPQIDLGTTKYKIECKSPLLMDKFPEEVKKQIEDKQTGKKQLKKQNREIDKEIESAVHKTSDGTIGYPAIGFKSGLIEATSFIGDKFFSKRLLRGIQIVNAVEGLVPINFKKRDILVHSIKSNTKHTPQFHDWDCELVIQYDKNNISAEDLATLINYAGFYFGVGMWSPRCKSGGSYGMYQLAKKV